MPHNHKPSPHGRHAGETADWTEMLEALEREGEVTAPWVREAITWLGSLAPAPPRRVIDVGSGPGIAAVLFGEAFPSARVVAYDGTAALLERATERAAAARLLDRFETRRGHIGEEMVAIGPADLVWASHVVHHLDDPTAGLAQLGELLRPAGAAEGGGLLALAEGGLPMRFLPGGYGVGGPGLISRLDAAIGDHALHNWGMTQAALGGERDWPLMMSDSGLEHVASRNFLLDLPAPLDDHVREFVVRRFDFDAELRRRLSEDDAAALARLVDPDDPAALVNRPDLFVLTAQTVHVARRR